MVRFAVLRALAIAAVFAVVWLVPSVASAMIIPVCDGDTASILPAQKPTDVETTTDCAAPMPSDEADDSIAAMCDIRGATTVAPDRIHPESDARIDAVVSCDGSIQGPLLGPSHGEDGPASVSHAIVQHAVLAGMFDLRPALHDELPPYLPVTGAPQAGFGCEIYHPPRG